MVKLLNIGKRFTFTIGNFISCLIKLGKKLLFAH